jgi:hypothetical protein
VIDDGLTFILTTGIAITVSVAEAEPVPAELLQLNVYVNVPAEFIAPVFWEPLPDFVPFQLLLAVHDVGLFAVDQVSVELLPVPIVAGLALIDTTGVTAPPPPEVTSTVVVALSEPPALLHVKV